MKHFLTALLVSLAAQAAYPFVGGHTGNGGDSNELAFKNIATNIKDWVQSGNANGLQLPAGLSVQSYKARMSEALSNYNISFTRAEVRVSGAEKTCRNWIDRSGKNILCNSLRFQDQSLEEQYRLVHHEFAGLAELEVNNGQDSSYQISNQISAYLRNEIVRRLPVVPEEQNAQDGGIQRYMAPYSSTDGKGELLPGFCDQHNLATVRDHYFKLFTEEIVKLLAERGLRVKQVVSTIQNDGAHKNDGYVFSLGKISLSFILENSVVLDAQVTSLSAKGTIFGKTKFYETPGRFNLVTYSTSEQEFSKDGQIIFKKDFCKVHTGVVQFKIVNRQTQVPIIWETRKDIR